MQNCTICHFMHHEILQNTKQQSVLHIAQLIMNEFLANEMQWFAADIHKLMRHLANIFSGQFLLCNCKSGRCHIANWTPGQCLLRNWTYAFLTCMHRSVVQDVAQCNSCNIIGTTWGRQDWGTPDWYIFWILQKLFCCWNNSWTSGQYPSSLWVKKGQICACPKNNPHKFSSKWINYGLWIGSLCWSANSGSEHYTNETQLCMKYRFWIGSLCWSTNDSKTQLCMPSNAHILRSPSLQWVAIAVKGWDRAECPHKMTCLLCQVPLPMMQTHCNPEQTVQ